MSDGATLGGQRQIIASIRRKRFQLDHEGSKAQESDELREMLDTTLKLLADDIYSSDSHFVLELIQNADDNTYSEGVVPRLSFTLAPDRLVVVNNEVGFTEKNVQALCTIGRSSKKKLNGYIGEKGIGFKSVFTVSDAPEIHSNGFHFCFDRSDPSKLLGYVIPTWREPIREVDPSRTTIILPAKSGSVFETTRLDEVDGRLLLFLNKIRELDIRTPNGLREYRRTDARRMTVLTSKHGGGQGEGEQPERYFRSTKAVDMNGIVEEKRKDVVSTELSLAFPVNGHGKAMPDRSSFVFAFLPIREYGLRFCIQGDFVLASSRGEIKERPAWNRRLRDQIPRAFIEAIDRFKELRPLAMSYLHFVPQDTEITDAFLKPIGPLIHEGLRNAECIPCADGIWRRPNEVGLAPRDFRALFSSEEVNHLFGLNYADPDLDAPDGMLRKLGAIALGVTSIVTMFREHGEWFVQKDLQWRAKLYAYLSTVDRKVVLASGLRKAPCIPSPDGTMLSPDNGAIFFPLTRGRKRKYDFEHELRLVDSELLDSATALSERTVGLFEDLGVERDDPYRMVISYILPLHKGDNWKKSQHKALLGHLRYIKDKLEQYLAGSRSAGNTDDIAIAALRSTLWIGSKKKDEGGSWWFRRTEDIYLSSEYKPDLDIERLLGADAGPNDFVSEDYLGVSAKPDSVEANEEQISTWRTFLLRLGVLDSPKLTMTADGNWHCSPEMGLLMASTKTPVRRELLEALDRNWTRYSGKISFHRQRYGMQSTAFAIALRDMQAPTRKHASVPMKGAFLKREEITRVFGDEVVYVEASLSSPGLITASQVTHKLDAAACIKRLMQMQAESRHSRDRLRTIYRKLEEHLGNDSVTIKNAFAAQKLICLKADGQPRWHTASDVVWKSSGPFLDSIYPSMEVPYREHMSFFSAVGVASKLSILQVVSALRHLGRVELPESRRREAMGIYKRASHGLAFIDSPDDEDIDWLTTLREEKVLLDRRGGLQLRDAAIFIDDDPRIAEMFAEEESVHFFASTIEELPGIRKLVDAIGVRYLSKSVERTVIDEEPGVPADYLEQKVRERLICVARVMYHRDPTAYEKCRDGGGFGRLMRMQILEVPTLQVSVSLEGAGRVVVEDMELSGERLFVRVGALAITIHLASRMCKVLGASLDLADAIELLLEKSDLRAADEWLRAKGIRALPPEEESDFRRSTNLAPVAEPADEDEEEPGAEVTESGPHPGPVEPEAEPPNPVEADDVEPGSTGGRRRPRNPAGKDAAGGGDEVGGEERDGDTRSQPGTEGEVGRSRAGHGPRHHDRPNTVQFDGRHARPDGGLDRPRKPEHEGPRPPPSEGEREKRQNKGRLLSYAETAADSSRDDGGGDGADARMRIADAAVEYFVQNARDRWQALEIMPPNNPGFDLQAITTDAELEYIEVKGQSAEWSEAGVALTPTEMLAAHRYRESYWLCVVEYALDPQRRRMHLVRDPFGSVHQFRFDVGWKSKADADAGDPLRPSEGMVVEIPDDGRGMIVAVESLGQFERMLVRLDSGSDVKKIFNPSSMKLSRP